MLLWGIILFALTLLTKDAWAKGDDSSSESNPENTTTTTNQDNRVAADGQGVALGQGAVLNYENNFSDNVRTTIKEALQLARDAGEQAVKFSQAAIKASENATSAVSSQAAESAKALSAQAAATSQRVQDTIDAQTQGSGTIIKQLAPFVVVGILGVFLIVYYFGKGKK